MLRRRICTCLIDGSRCRSNRNPADFRDRLLPFPIRAGPAVRVLIVDGDSAVADATAMLLEIEGHDVMLASTVEEASAFVAARGAPDAIVCDFYLPHARTAIDAITALRAHAGRMVPAVIITSESHRSAAFCVSPGMPASWSSSYGTWPKANARYYTGNALRREARSGTLRPSRLYCSAPGCFPHAPR